ncbi:MAG: M48 family metalloprotease [Armatimonadota bacterium]|nr:M48 family metalloprotease [Armatimonadota bacterium]MDR7421624.1 M48 family metalloprotease [Armatimonadota bacterium]MDR7455871.1 M48 family metalloprotease [Armatimonadota bacterium]MDR7497942.1 M48 family metalloprotease [Armatimonadota bacterium]MDR7513097.1 M48 family metalloprotease [Armatimonadota bacterium]
MTRLRRPTIVLLAALLVAALLPLRAVAAPSVEAAEIQAGRQAAQQIESRYKLVTDEAAVARVARIGAVVAAQTPRPHLPYTFKIVDIPQVNAVALPGGFIYVTAGLLGFVRSDHELAAVLAHEAAHAALGHGMEMQRRANRALFLTLLVAIFTRDPTLFQGASLLAAGFMAGYSRDLEREADLASVDYLTRTPYSPVGVLTVLERLHRLERFTGQLEVYAFADHPRTAERVQYVHDALRARGIPLNRRTPMNYLVLSVRGGSEGGAPYAEIVVNDRPIVRLRSLERIREAAETLDRLFDSDLEPYEVTARETDGGWGVFARGFAVLRFGADDLPPGVASPREAATGVMTRLRNAIDEDIRRRRLDG